MSALLVGYGRVSTHDQDLTAQRDALSRLVVSAERTYIDHGLTGTNRERPGGERRLRPAAAATRPSSRSSIAWLGRCRMREILEDLTRREVKPSIGGSVHDPTDPVGRLLFNVLATSSASDDQPSTERSSATPSARSKRAPLARRGRRSVSGTLTGRR